MTNIQVKYMIESESWFKCTTNENIEFKVRVLSMHKLNSKEIDSPESLMLSYDFTQGDLWLLKLDIINCNKTEIHVSDCCNPIIVVDQDSFIFSFADDWHLRCMSNVAKTKGMSNFFGCNLSPKIKATGTIPYYLPREEESEYSIGIKDGNIQEL